MNRIACLSISWILYLSLFLLPTNAFPDTRVDPHGKEDMCRFCHGPNMVEQGKPGFRLNTVEATCLGCHGERGATLEDYLRRMLPEVETKEEMVAYFSKHPDFSCQSCHNAMCLRNSRKQLQYRNPHIQLDTDGKIVEQACLFCHTIVPDYRHPSREHTTMRYNLLYLCSVCHVMNAQKRGLGFGKPMAQAMVRKKEQFEREYDVTLPLGPDNTVVCASCHNPHQAGVILGRNNNMTSSHEHRLLLEDIWTMCTACHLGNYKK